MCQRYRNNNIGNFGNVGIGTFPLFAETCNWNFVVSRCVCTLFLIIKFIIWTKMSAAPKASETPFSRTWYFPSGAVTATAGSSTFHLLFLFILASFVQAVTTCYASKFLMANSSSIPTASCNQSYPKFRHSLSNVSVITTQAESAAKIAAFRPPPWPNLQNLMLLYNINLSLTYATEFRSMFHLS